MVQGFARGAMVLATVLALATAASPAAAPVASATSMADVEQSYRLITTTYYSKVDPQRLVDGARAGLSQQLKKQHVRYVVPAVQASTNADQNVAEVNRLISRTAQATHQPVTVMTYAALAGMTNAVGDRWTEFFTPDDLRAFNNALDPEKISGIGVLLDPQPDPVTKFVRAYYVVPGTPADKAGIQSGDLFTSIDGTSTRGFTNDKAVKLLRGKTGTVVQIAVQRDTRKLGTLSLTRSEVQPPTVTFKMLPQSIGYIFINAFGRETPQEFSVALSRLESAGAKAYVLDLRNNGGGYVNSALDISAHFINTDPLLIVEERGEHSTRIDADGTAIASKPLTVLVNRYTASASEIMSGALQDDGVGTLVGEKTFGKGVMQTLSPLPDGAAIKITTAHYLTPKSRDINLKGIVPDMVVAENKNARFGELSNDAQLQAAVTVITKKIADATRTVNSN
jgi:carboxyl-terminal processing protease